MDHHFGGGGGGNWTMIPNIQTHSNPATPSNQDHLFLQQHQQQFNQQQQQQQFHQPRFHHQQPQLLSPQQQQQQQPQLLSPPQQPQLQSPQQYQLQSPPQQQPNQSLASHFHLLHLVEKLADVSENGTRDQQADSLIGELNSQFEKCQQLLNSIGGTIKVKSTTVEDQKRRLEETENLLNQRRDLISKYRSSVEDFITPQV